MVRKGIKKYSYSTDRRVPFIACIAVRISRGSVRPSPIRVFDNGPGLGLTRST